MTEKYDVVVIGAGIGGLVCGCYLAKAGLKVLIVEQHNKPGGYCTSFERQGYRFDVGVHYLGGVKSGYLSRIFRELGIFNQLELKQFDPSNKIILPGLSMHIRDNVEATIEEFRKLFPKDISDVRSFFDFIIKPNFLDTYAKTYKLNLQELLDLFFRNKQLIMVMKALSGIGNFGIPLDKTSAVSSILLFREFLFDPGWYPMGGIQKLPDILVKNIEEYKGRILFSRKVRKIISENSIAKGIILEDGAKIISKIVVSNCDATQTFKKLLNIKNIEYNKVDRLQISPSFFCVYLGLNDECRNKIIEPAAVWFFDSNNIDSCYRDVEGTMSLRGPRYLLCAFPFMSDGNIKNKPTMEIFVAAPFKTRRMWDQYRNVLMEKIIRKAHKVIPNLNNYIDYKFNATPHTLFEYTSNRKGAAYGWSSRRELLNDSVFSSRTSIRNLYLSSHWTTGGLSQGGIPQVSVIGRQTARLILKQLNLPWEHKLTIF
ncbi:MAG: NAD(P)/FAD-dependent oxidoreductase [Candidatus Omnitrophica bacterium]|nr:NAD(P)/FAD-dependent oxidoreductase [Candidatus Omnitrophota bacterium]